MLKIKKIILVITVLATSGSLSALDFFQFQFLAPRTALAFFNLVALAVGLVLMYVSAHLFQRCKYKILPSISFVIGLVIITIHITKFTVGIWAQICV
jgi:hypothetical protein